MQAAGTGQGVEDASAFCPGMAAEEEGVLAGEGDVSVDQLDLAVLGEEHEHITAQRRTAQKSRL